MAKSTGLGITTLSIDDDAGTPRAIKNDFTNFDIATPYANQDVTGVDKYAMERLPLLADLNGTLNGVFNPAANEGHAVFSGDLRVARTLTLVVLSQTLAPEVLFTDYKLTRASGGEFTYQAPFVLSDGTVPTWS